MIKHGEGVAGKRTALYWRWMAMRNRCTNPRNPAYKWYGAKGIRVCKRWDDFAKFKEDVGEVPGPGYSLDRIDFTKGYKPGNVRWATAEQQSNNSRGVRLVTLPDGRQMSIAAAERAMGMPPTRLRFRIRCGWPQKHWFDLPGTSTTSWKPNNRRKIRLVTLPDGRKISMADAQRVMGMKKGTLSTRIWRGWKRSSWLDPPRR